MKDRKKIYGKGNIMGIQNDVKKFFEYNKTKFAEKKKQELIDLKAKRTKPVIDVAEAPPITQATLI